MQSFNCHCPERKKPVDQRAWVVTQRLGNASAFNGYRWQPSDWSSVFCLGCHAFGRTKASYVSSLRDGRISNNPPIHGHNANYWNHK
jgi:hypothetical protein